MPRSASEGEHDIYAQITLSDGALRQTGGGLTSLLDTVNFVRDFLETREPTDVALVELRQDGTRREITFAEVNDRSARLAGTFVSQGVTPGDVVLTLIGSRAEWVYSMVACFRIGAVALPCNEQLRGKDLELRAKIAEPRLLVTDERNLSELQQVNQGLPTLVIPDEQLFESDPAPLVDLSPNDSCLIIFTSGTSGQPKAVLHGQKYLGGQALQSSEWFGAKPGDLAWCTAASGWSKSARNVFVAPWLCGATALLHDGRFDPDERLEILRRERVNTLCMAPTEYRVIAKRSELVPLPELHGLVAAGEALNPEVIEVWKDAVGVEIPAT